MATQQILEGFHMSPQQKRVWASGANHHSRYRAQAAILIEGDTDAARLKSAVEQVVEQSEILRTRFCSLPGMEAPLQVIGEPCIPWDQTADFSRLAPDAQASEIQSAFTRKVQSAFDLENGPPVHGSLFKLAGDKHVL